jgi:glyoxylase-like metal-dependent hydrolase (beta-lactamase superfamily II)
MLYNIDLKFLGISQAIGCYIIKTEEGLVLVETGPYSTFAELTRQIEGLGFRLSDVKKVLLTHIHLDHAGAAWAFAEYGADIYVHPIGYKHLADPSKLMESAKRIYKEDMDRLWGKMEAIPQNQLFAIEDGAAIEFGDNLFIAHHTPGHAVHHIAWQLDDMLFTGDVGGVKIGEDGMAVPPCPPPDINIEDWQDSIDKIRKMPVETLYLTHYGKVTNKLMHLAQLEETLLSWANWMKPKFDAGSSVEDITPEFMEFVKGQLAGFGLDNDRLAQYEAANPSFMSVAGLLRYWKKKTG